MLAGAPLGAANDRSVLNAYTVAGNPKSARRAVLIHSLAMDRGFWRPVAERMDCAVLLYDCTGHGESAKPAGSYTVEGFAEDLAALLDDVGWQRALLAGASMGGCVALAFAAKYPERAAALGLVDTTAWYGPEAPRQWEERAQIALAGGLEALVDFQLTRWFTDAFRERHPDVVSQCVATFLKNDVNAYAASCRMLGAADLRRSLAGIRVPTAVLVGEEDYATPLAMAQTLHRGIAGSTLRVLKNARHLTPLERPDEVAAALARLAAPVAVA